MPYAPEVNRQSPPVTTPMNTPLTPPVQQPDPIGQRSEQKTRDSLKEESDPTVRIHPHFLFSLVYQGFVLSLFVAAGYFAVAFVKLQLNVDILDTVTDAFREIAASSAQLGVGDISLPLFFQLQRVLYIVFLEIVIAAFVLQIPIVNRDWILHHDRVEIRGGFFGKNVSIRLFDVIAVNYKRYLPGLDFGKLTLEHTGGEDRLVELPYVLWAQQATGVIYDEVARERAKASTQAVAQDKVQVPPSSDSGQAPPS